MKTSVSGHADLAVPQDICNWVNAKDLTVWVHEEIKKLAQTEPPGSAAHSIFKDPMLPVLVFAYARGVFDHEEIADLCNSDPVFKEVAGGPASSAELQSLRHRDRAVLIKLVREVLIRAARQKLNLAADLSPGLYRRLQDEAVVRLDNARHIDRGDEV